MYHFCNKSKQIKEDSVPTYLRDVQPSSQDRSRHQNVCPALGELSQRLRKGFVVLCAVFQKYLGHFNAASTMEVFSDFDLGIYKTLKMTKTSTLKKTKTCSL